MYFILCSCLTYALLLRAPYVHRVRITLQNQWEWEAETLLFEGVNENQFLWKVRGSPGCLPGKGNVGANQCTKRTTLMHPFGSDRLLIRC